MGTQQIIINGHSGIFPSGYSYCPNGNIPDDVADIFGSIGGACLLYSNGFTMNVSFEGLSCRGLEWIVEFLGNHPLSTRIQHILDAKIDEIYALYDIMVNYAYSRDDRIIIQSISDLRLLGIVTVDKTLDEIVTSAMTILITSNDLVVNRKGLLVKDLLMMGAVIYTTRLHRSTIDLYDPVQ